jgi:RNA polymerase sigma-70 factor (ECF subfamily)
MRPPRPPGFATLVREHQGQLRAFLRRVCWSFDQADDLAQETFITAWQNLGRFRGDSSFRSWLFGIGYRKALASGRTRSRRAAREAEAAAAGAATEPVPPELRLDLQSALATLSEAQQAAVALCWGSGFSHEEAAQTLELPLGTVKSHLSRAREKMRAKLESSDGTA